MPTFKILDDLNTPLLDVVTPRDSGLGRYLPAPVVRLMALRPAVAALQRRLSDAPTNPVSIEFALPDGLELGGDLSVGAAARAAIGVHQPDELLFPADDLRDAVTVPSGTAYVSIALAPRVEAGADGRRGPLAFGFDAGASLTMRFLAPFDVTGSDPTLATAISDTLQAAVVPADLDDLLRLPLGAYASVEGEGEVHLSTDVELASVTNPLATPGLPVVGSARVAAGASVAVGAEVRASGAFELRATKIAADRIRLSYYRRAGSEISVTASASVGVSAQVGDSDPIKLLLRATSSDPAADLTQLVEAGLSDAQIDALQKAVTASIDRSLRLATEVQFSSVRHGEALFAYEIDGASAAAPDVRAAVDAALRGELTAINRLALTNAGPIRALQTGVLTRRERRVSWRINLFGIVNVRSVAELLRTGSLSYDPVTGALSAADAISSRRILVKTRPFESDARKVRTLTFESMIVTAAYNASRVTPASVGLTCSCSYFESRARTRRQDVRADYTAILGLGLADAAERDRRLGSETDFGPSTFLIDCTLDRAAADALFIGPNGPLGREHYERIGRDALLALIPPDDTERAHRRAAVEGDASWKALTNAGPAAARFELARRFDAVRAEHIISDYVLIRWWADGMSEAARALVAMRQFLSGRSAPSLAADPEFVRRRAKLEKELADVVKDSKAQLGDPWGILALDAACGRAASVQATIVSPRLTAAYADRIVPAPRSTQAPAVAAGARAEAPALAVPRKPPLTGDQIELLRRHAINLRLGAFSTDGEFQTDEADVRRIFTELLPEEIASRRSAGGRARVMFYAHGGLTGERDGLEPVLARLKFWRQNDIYPISFVWETGLTETITDIVRGLRGARELVARGIGEDLADAFLEVAARPAGKRVWSQMKRSAEVAALAGGGALIVSQFARDLWNVHHADVEFHAAGHSAGAIFQAHFLPTLLRPEAAGGVPPLHVRSLHLLAPACTTDLFNNRLKDLVGADRPVRALTMYTMSKGLELEDRAGPYRKSLLYLVSRAFESEQPARILGLEESLRQEAGLIRFFGLAGNQKEADVLFSRTPPTASLRDRTLSTSHGGFDEDAATMNSLVRRVLEVADTTPIVDFFQEARDAAVRDRDAVADALSAALQPAGRDSLVPGAGGDGAPATQPAPPLVEVASGRRLALCVGIDKYGSGYDLHGCVNDASNWGRALKSLQFEVTSLLDRSASRAAILDAFASLTAGAAPGDVIVFQFAGHGTQVDDLDRDEPDALDEAFCPADFASGRLLIDDDIKAVIAQLKPGVNLTCFIDCCHSGTITRALVPGGRPPLVPPGSRARFIRYSRALSDLHREFRQTSEGHVERARAAEGTSTAVVKEVCFSACQPHEVAYETDGAGQFSTRAVQVLTSGSDLTNGAFLEKVVAAFGMNPAQHPYLDCAEEAKNRGLLKAVAAPAF